MDVAEVGASFCGGDDVCDDGGGEGDGAAGAGGLEAAQYEQGGVGLLQGQPDVCSYIEKEAEEVAGTAALAVRNGDIERRGDALEDLGGGQDGGLE